MRSSFWFARSFALGTLVFATGVGACTVIHRPCDLDDGPSRWCADDEDCEDLGVRCDRAARRCSAAARDGGARDGGPHPADVQDAALVTPPCTSARDCAGETVCSAGACVPASAVCQFDFQCASGRECVDGRCLGVCSTAANCAPGQVCEAGGHCRYPSASEAPGRPGSSCTPAGGACAAGQQCVGGACLAGCASDAQCALTPAGERQRCEQGSCRVDDRRAPPFCASDAQCATGSVCRAGVCRAACPTGTDDECQRRDVNFNRCGPERLCVSSGEIAPGCALSIDCPAGQSCNDARCR